MPDVLIIEASPRKGLSLRYAERFAALLEAKGLTSRLLRIKELEISPCVACNACFERGEARCPYHGDGVSEFLSALLEARAAVFFVPNYSLQVPAPLKQVIDRLAFVFHRPRLFGKKSMALVTQGVYGGKGVAAYLDSLMGFWARSQ
jgi:multimeric flavodoxin WrbA